MLKKRHTATPRLPLTTSQMRAQKAFTAKAKVKS
jgi:hypothetical protein